MATTDLHGHLLPHDYITDTPTHGEGLAGLGHLISDARAQAEAVGTPVILLDNGDTFQGTPLASYLAAHPVMPEHPIIASLNHLAYDAIGLGNHDLDHGLTYLRAVETHMNMPILNANLRGVSQSPLKRSLLLTIPTPADCPAPLTVGILSILPPQSAAWHSHHLGPSVVLEDPAQSLKTQSNALRQEGADLIIVLAHMGVGKADGTDSDRLAAQALVQTGGFDLLILGHTHRRYPSPDYDGRKGTDIDRCTLGGIPTVMAGHSGSDLAVVDLELSHDADRGWHVAHHMGHLHPNQPDTPIDLVIRDITKPVHAAVRKQLNTKITTAARDIHSYFSLAMPAHTQRLTAQAHYALMRDALKDTPESRLPLLATAAAHGAGGRDGLGNYVHVPKGPILHRHVSGMLPFANQAVAIRINGAQLRDWLEHAALVFNQITSDHPTQLLLNPDIPAFHCDTIFGLNYQIDPSAPALKRISNITYDTRLVGPEQDFMLATTQFRISGGGGYAPPPNVAAISNRPVQDALSTALSTPSSDPWADAPTWRFAPLGGMKATFHTHPNATNHLSDISHLHPNPVGTTLEGFIKLQLTL
ncbi:MAG: 5'-nucleotidase C-terminal domain-containing protein [Sulfitobacter sp.]